MIGDIIQLIGLMLIVAVCIDYIRSSRNATKYVATYEYMDIFFDVNKDGSKRLASYLNHYGEDGWEAYQVTASGTELLVFLKRETIKEERISK